MNVRLLVLGLLDREPLHGYELRRLATESRIDSWAGILPGSIYHALKTMEREGLVAPRKEKSVGRRSRTVYGITAAGRRAFRALAKEALDQPIRSFPTDLYGGLLFQGTLDPADVDAALDRQIEALRADLARWVEARPRKEPLPADGDALFDHGIRHLELDLELLLGLRARRRDNRAEAGR